MNDPRTENTDLSSVFQDKSSTASVCPSAGSAAAAPCHHSEQAAISGNSKETIKIKQH